MKNPKYIQIVNCGRFGFALWDFPQSHTFYPIHGKEEECIKWAFENDYEIVCESPKRMILKLKGE